MRKIKIYIVYHTTIIFSLKQTYRKMEDKHVDNTRVFIRIFIGFLTLFLTF